MTNRTPKSSTPMETQRTKSSDIHHDNIVIGETNAAFRSLTVCSKEEMNSQIERDDSHEVWDTEIGVGLPDEPHSHQPLKYDKAYPEDSHQQRSHNIQFDSDVIVVFIPSRHQYPLEMKQRLWNISSQPTRNSLNKNIKRDNAKRKKASLGISRKPMSSFAAQVKRDKKLTRCRSTHHQRSSFVESFSYAASN